VSSVQGHTLAARSTTAALFFIHSGFLPAADVDDRNPHVVRALLGSTGHDRKLPRSKPVEIGPRLA